MSGDGSRRKRPGTKGKPSTPAAQPARVRTVKEIAAAANVSVATVSRALQRPEIVSETTRQHIHEVVKRLGYTPNALARNLRTARTRLIIALLPDIANPFFSEVIRGIEQVAHESGYSVLLGETQGSLVREQAYADMVAARQADGIITMSPRVPAIPVQGRLPVVNACEYVKDAQISSVYVDNVAAAGVAVDYLVMLGHRDIAFVGGPPSSPICVDREQGYRLALKRADMAFRANLTVAGDFSIEAGERAIELLLAQGRSFSAVFCANDEMAIGAMRALAAHGLRVPEDVSVVGFDDIRFARYTTPALTTVAQPKNALGREAMTMLIELLNDTGVPPRKRVLSADLVVRGSSAPPSRTR
ncbi:MULTISPECIES: LacI family DNA-binding transcriptional regulator [unclassified Dyella]|uniref:LacI family DNA-binding transcriptional regulator n=1 Tax=unclassified Dyella TaxID=2634549 RepID=UPI000CC094A7|nr:MULTISPECIES: LacI family DNA-binding transcriptional regulator [unclassified Dyella]MDR3447729.1 LacI family DNA-binding transcriptional regulator [Dyella sp.]PMQ05391.1 HTH-type transcriptional repressor CytR [Dyella sp. AD56]